MATDRYSDDHKIVVGGGNGTLTVDGNLIITGSIGNIEGSSISVDDITADGAVTLSGQTVITTPGGDIDFSSSSFEIKKIIPMSYLEWLDTNGYSNAAVPPLFQPQINVGSTSSENFTFSTPGLLFQSSGDSITIPVHEFLKKGNKINVRLVCEFEVPIDVSFVPCYLSCKKILKTGSGVSPYYDITQSATPIAGGDMSFLNDNRRFVSENFSVAFDSSQDFVFLRITRGETSGGNFVIYSVEISTEGNFYDIIGLT